MFLLRSKKSELLRSVFLGYFHLLFENIDVVTAYMLINMRIKKMLYVFLFYLFYDVLSILPI